MARRVVVTGMGTVNPLAHTVDEFWAKIRNGENGIKRITRFDVSTYSSQIGGEVRDFDPTDYIDKKDARRMDRLRPLVFSDLLHGQLCGGRVRESRGLLLNPIFPNLDPTFRMFFLRHSGDPPFIKTASATDIIAR